MNQSFSTTIQIKQHTPLIHFQYSQSGAALRATELKPKLDKFLIKKVFKGDFQEYKNYLVEHDENQYKKLNEQEKTRYEKDIHKALDYKITVIARDQSHFSYKVITENKTGILYSQMNINIFCFHQKLLNIINQYINEFFILHQFGLGQSKGFGGFTTRQTTPKLFEQILEKNYHVIYKKELKHIKNYKDVLEIIKREYQMLKSGINFKGYVKSKLFQYMCREHDIDWEKRYIKETLKKEYPEIFSLLLKDTDENRIQRCPSSLEKPGYKYIRALLGLAEHNEYRVDKRKSPLEKIKIIIKDKQEQITRFQSPIQFKIFKENNNYTLYLLPQPIVDDIFDREFSFWLEKAYQDKKRKESLKHLFTIPTPKKEQFDLVGFLDSSLEFRKSSSGYGWERTTGELQK
jgi:hypothetical protein